MFSATDKCGQRLSSWGAIIIPFMGVHGNEVQHFAISREFTGIWLQHCQMMFMSVLLPAPFSPMSAWTCPLRMSKLTFLRACVPEKLFETLRTSKNSSALLCNSGVSIVWFAAFAPSSFSRYAQYGDIG